MPLCCKPTISDNTVCSLLSQDFRGSLKGIELKIGLKVIKFDCHFKSFKIRKPAVIWTRCIQPILAKTTSFLLVLRSVSPYRYCRKVQEVEIRQKGINNY